MVVEPQPAKKSAGRRSQRTVPTAASSPRKQLMENEVLEHATRLFAERGFAGTSLQDIAAAMGLKRPALYYYFKSKDELLDRLIVEGVSGPARELKAIADDADLGAPQRLHEIARRNVIWVLNHTDRFLLLVKSESELSAKSARKFNTSRRAAVDIVAGVIDDGIAAGQFRAVNSRVAALSVFGVTNWAAWWFQRGGPDSVEDVADQLADLSLASLQRPDVGNDHALSPATAMAALRRSVDQLDQAISKERPA